MRLKTLSTLLLIFSLNTLAQESAHTLLEQAKTKASTEGKNIFIKYSASWCKYCLIMDKQLKSKSCQEYFDNNYVMVTLTVNESRKYREMENPGAAELLENHKGVQAGMPFWIILNEKGKPIADPFDANGESLGYPSDSKEIEDFIAILDKVAPMSDMDKAGVRRAFLEDDKHKKSSRY